MYSQCYCSYNKVIIINNTFLNNSAACPPINIDNGERCIILNNTFINNNARPRTAHKDGWK